MCEYEEGDEIKHLDCLHKYHVLYYIIIYKKIHMNQRSERKKEINK